MRRFIPDGLLVPLGFLLAADAVFITLHVLHLAEGLYVGGILEPDPHFAIDRERGYPEVFEYIKLYWAAVGAGWLWWRTRQALYGTGAALFLFLVVDNSGALHERAGDWMIRTIDFGWGAQVLGSDIGQMIYWMGVGGVVFVGGWTAYRRAGSPARRQAKQIAWGLAGLVVFGVGVDALHNAVVLATDAVWADELLTVVEDGSELVLISWICAVVVSAVLLDTGAAGDEPVGPLRRGDEPSVGA
jgi:hypothetical protein